MRSWKVLLPLLASSLCFAAQPDRISGPIDSSQMVPLKGNVHRLAQPQYDQGPVEDSLQFGYVTLVMTPTPGQQVALNQLLAQQQDRSSPNYHRWLTPQLYADRFGLSQNDISKITTWLSSQGMQIVSIGGGRNSVVFSGTAAQIQSAFKTQIHRYNINGKVHIANSTPPSMPVALSGVIAQVRGLTDFRPKPMYVRPVHDGKLGSHPSYTTTVQGKIDYFVAPGDTATLYDLNPLYSASPAIDGTNQKLAIIGQTDIYLADITNFRSGFGLNPITGCTANATTGILTACDSTNFKYVVVGTDLGTPSTCGDLVEADLDIEWSGATARNAQIIYVNAPATFNADCTQLTNSGGVNAALDAAINPPSGPPLAPVISMSYGLCEADAESLETELEQANVEGVTILNSAGDTGSAACDGGPPGTNPQPPFEAAQFGLAVSYPASSPEVTGVGGTSIPAADFTAAFWSGTNGTAGGSALDTLIGQEAAWNDDEALAQYCLENPTNPSCNPSPGVKVTSAQTFQQDYWISVGGGGVSNCINETGDVCNSGFARPSWQSVTIPGLGSPQSTYRFVPDVSLLASPNFPGYIFCTPVENLSSTAPYDTETASSCANGIAAAADGVVSGNNLVVEPSVIGGTSASTPVFAGIVTLLNQYLGSGGLGNINPTLYGLASTPATAAFHSVKSGDNNVYCQGGQPSGNPADVICPSTGTSAGVIGFSASNADATTGYNLVTGLGSVDANVLAVAWKASLDPDFQLAVGALNPTSIPAGASTSTTVTISAIAGSTGVVVNFSPNSCTGLPSGATCSFNPASVTFDGTDSVTTQLTISTVANMTVPSSAQLITITPINSPNTTAQVSLDVTATNQTFSIASNAKTYSVVPGGTAQVQLTVAGTNGFVNSSNSTTALPVTYQCAQNSLPNQVQCSFSPTAGNAVSSSALTLNIATTGPTSRVQPPLGNGRLYYALLLPGLFGIVFASGSRSRAARLLSLIVVLGFSSVGLSSCGGSSGGVQKNTGTPPGTYAIVVNATTAGPNALTASLTVNLTVTQ